MAMTFDDVLAIFPDAEQFTAEQAAPFLEAASMAFPDSRFASPKLGERGRANYVMHMLTKPPLDLAAPWIVARVNSRSRPDIQAPHVWDGTQYGASLKATVKSR